MGIYTADLVRSYIFGMGRFYQTSFVSKRNRFPEEGVGIRSCSFEWKFVDTKLGCPIMVELKEELKRDNDRACISASVYFDDRCLDKQKVDEYVRKQLEQIAADGMVKL